MKLRIVALIIFFACLFPIVQGQAQGLSWKWTKELNTNIMGDGILGSPAIDNDGIIYTGGGSNGIFYALDPEKGDIKWERTLDDSYAINRWGVLSSPVIASDGTIFIGIRGRLFALNRLDGRSKWEKSFENHSSTIPASPALGLDGSLYMGLGDGFFYKIKPGDGSTIWKIKLKVLDATAPAIAVDGTVYLSSADGTFHALNPVDGTEKWSRQICSEKPVYSPAIGFDGTVYFGAANGYFYAYAPDGSEHWSHKVHVCKESYYTQPAITNDGHVSVGIDGAQATFDADDGYFIANNVNNSWMSDPKWPTFFCDFPKNVSTPVTGQDGVMYTSLGVVFYQYNAIDQDWATGINPPETTHDHRILSFLVSTLLPSPLLLWRQMGLSTTAPRAVK